MISAEQLLQKLIQFQSITPNDDGSLEYLSNLLGDMGFQCHIVEFAEEGFDNVKNLYARLGQGGQNFCFAGHIDVVPIGRLQDWQYPPFAGIVENGIIYGRGAVDMKGAIAAFIEALQSITDNVMINDRNISILITADEEGIAVNGIKKMVKWLEDRGEKIDFCLIGEPTSKNRIGDTIKVGARGSITLNINVFGKQGHVAYHELADNPITTLATIITALKEYNFDNGNIYFQASNLEFTDLSVGNLAENIIPAMAHARCNIRYGDMHTAESLATWVNNICSKYTTDFKVNWHSSGDAFLTKHEQIAPLLINAIKQTYMDNQLDIIEPAINTLGGTSDARFLTKYCQVLELGLLSQMAHKVDECTTLTDLKLLTQIYQSMLMHYKNMSS